MLVAAREPVVKDPKLAASMMQGAMSGVIRRLLESAAPEKNFETLRQELIFFVCAYLGACAAGHEFSIGPNSSFRPWNASV